MEPPGTVYYLVEQGLVDRWTVVRVPLATVAVFTTLVFATAASVRLLPTVSWVQNGGVLVSVALSFYVGYRALALIPAAGLRATLELSRDRLVLTEKNGTRHSLANQGWTKVSVGLAHQKARSADGEVYRLPGLVDRVESLDVRPYRPVEHNLRVALRDGVFFLGRGEYNPGGAPGFSVFPFE
ncbi:MAG: hypothetical protein ACYDCL_12260 [Myxococcales bacterium]